MECLANVPAVSSALDLERGSSGTGVATLWLDRPETRNALGAAFFDELPAAMTELSDDRAVRAIVVAARGPSFSVGLDVKELGAFLATDAGQVGGESGERASAERTGGQGEPLSPAARAVATRRSVRRLQAAITAVADCPKPVVAAVHGHCIGGGMDLATACDIRLASSDAIFSVRETRMALVADLGVLQRLPRIVGAGHLAELAFTGKDIDARRAKEIGLVNEVYPDRDALLHAATSLEQEIAALSPLAVQGTKSVLAANDGLTLAQALEYVATWNAGMLASEDLAEAVHAFLDKRPPRFTGA